MLGKKIRKEFPFYNKYDNLVYLDSAMTSLKPKILMDSLVDYYSNFAVTVGNNNNKLVQKTTKKFKESLMKIASFINADLEEIFFTQGTTDGINKISKLLFEKLNENDEIILGKMDHSSNFFPWYALSKKNKVKVKYYKLDKNGQIDLKHLKTLISSKTKILSCASTYNTLGSSNDVKKIREAIGNNIILFIDAAQSIAHIPIDVKKWDCDYLVFGAHKALGPTGLGIVYGKKENLKNFNPITYGGGMGFNSKTEEIEILDLPYKNFSGTQNVAGIISFANVLDFLTKIKIENIQKHTENLKDILEQKLSELKNVTIINKNLKSSILLFEIKGVHPEDVEFTLEKDNIFVRSGESCVKTNYDLFNPKNMIRISFHLYNDIDDIEKLVDAIKKGGNFIDGLFQERNSRKGCITS